MSYKLLPFKPGLEDAFYGLHCPAHKTEWCNCVAWWVNSWDGWGERTADQNRQLRESLLAQGEYDGYLLFDDDEPIAWCQVGRRDRLVKLVHQMRLEPDPTVWAVTCFLVAAKYRQQGVAEQMLWMLLIDLQEKGVDVVEAYPKRGPDLDEFELWNGSERMFERVGFQFVKEVGQRTVWRLAL